MNTTAEKHGPYAQLAAAFDDLGSRGVVARMDFACCQNCATTEIDLERTLTPDASEDDPYPWQENGYVLFHHQDSDRLREGDDTLYLAFGGFPGSDIMPLPVTAEYTQRWEDTYQQADLGIANTVVECLGRHGLTVRWDGDPGQRIGVVADFGAAPYPFPTATEYSEGHQGPRPRATDEAAASDTPAAYNPALAGEAWYILLERDDLNVGDLLYDLLPKTSAILREQGALTTTIPYEDLGLYVDVQIRGPIDDPAVVRDVEARSDAEATAQLSRHRSVLCIHARGSADGIEKDMQQATIALNISELGHPAVGGLWIPAQERYEPRGEKIIDGGMSGSDLVHLATHVRRVGDEVLVVTRGMACLGQMDMVMAWFDDEDTSLAQLMLVQLADDVARSGKAPLPGELLKTPAGRRVRARISEGTDPTSGRPATVVTPEKRKKILGLF